MTKPLDKFIAAYGDSYHYAFDNEIILNWYPQRIIKKTDESNSMLELGIGHGYTCNLFSRFYARYTVIDASASVIAQFKQQYPLSKANIIESYFECFDTNEKFDVLMMGFVLEHVDDPIHILNYFKRFIVPGGRCFITVPNAESLHRRIGHEAGLLQDVLTLGAGDQALGHQRLYTVDLLTNQLQQCGYRVIDREGIFLKPFTTNQLKSLTLTQDVVTGMCKVGINYPELSAALLIEARVDE